MWRLVRKRLLQLAAVVLGITLFTFLLLNLLPGDTALAILGPNATPSSVAQLRHQLGLTQPPLERYGHWLEHAVTGDLGTSPISDQSVGTTIFRRLPVTLEIVLLSQLVALMFAIPAAALAGRRPGRLLDRAAGAVAFVSVSLPAFLWGLVLILIVAVRFRLLPATGYTPLTASVEENLKSLVLPCGALGLAEFAVYFRLLRDRVIEEFEQEYVVIARATGMSGLRLTLGHVLPNSILNVVTVLGVHFAALLGGTVIIEQLFALPGIGQLLIQSITLRDPVTVEGVVVVVAIGVVLVNLLVDLTYHILDPRLRTAA